MKIAVLFSFVLLSLGACGAAGAMGSEETLRYKMTVTVTTPEGDRTASAVREAGTYYERSILPDQGGRFFNITKGEAVVVDLGKRGVLFALLGGQGEAEDVFKTFPEQKKNAKATLPPEKYPPLVRFRDLKDPKTVEPVYETEFYDARDEKGNYIGRRFRINADHTEKMFGGGVKIKEVTVEMTGESITESIEPYMPHFDGKPHLVNRGDFIRGK